MNPYLQFKCATDFPKDADPDEFYFRHKQSRRFVSVRFSPDDKLLICEFGAFLPEAFDYLAPLAEPVEGMRWVKASERLPEVEGEIHMRLLLNGTHINTTGCFYKEPDGKLIVVMAGFDDQDDSVLHRILWLDESAASTPTAKEPVSGMGWVKASERLPEKEGYYCCRISGGYMGLRLVDIGAYKRFEAHNRHVVKRSTIEWLDESTQPTPSAREAELEREVERLKGLIEKAFDSGVELAEKYYAMLPSERFGRYASYLEWFKKQHNL